MNLAVVKASFRLIALFLLGLVLLAAGLHVFKGLRIDLTEDKIFTLSDGAENMLRNLDSPVEVSFFYSEEAMREHPSLRNYAHRIEDMLREFELASEGKLTVSKVDPEPFSEAEDVATELGIQAVPLRVGGPQLYLGLNAQGADGVDSTIGFMHPNREQHLEYDVAKAIYLASRPTPPAIGLMSGAQVQGGVNMATRSMAQPWTAVTQLQQLFEIVDLGAAPTVIPDTIDLLLVIHPAELPDQSLYAIDQYLLSGRQGVIFVDPFAEHADTGAMVPPPGATPISSELDKLFNAWGIEMIPGQALGDAAHAMLVNVADDQPPARHLTLLGFNAENIVEQAMVTEGLETINLASAGILRLLPDSTAQWQPLLQSSKAAGPVPVESLKGLVNPNALFNDFLPVGERFAVAGLLRTQTSSAFPDGKPAGHAESIENYATETPNTDTETPEGHISEGDINVLIVADTDVLTDRLWVQAQSFFGRQVLNPFADNGSLLVNSVDYLVGSKDLISIRSRGRYNRPFDRVHDIQRDAEEEYRAKADELQAQLNETEKQLTALLSQAGEGQASLTPEQELVVDEFVERKLALRKALREVNHQLTRDIEDLGVHLKVLNIVVIPALLTLLALGVHFLRRRRA